MSEKEYRLTESELEAIVKSAVREANTETKYQTLTAQNLFNNVKFDGRRDILPINVNNERIKDKLTGNPTKVYSNIPFAYGWQNERYSGVHNSDIHTNIRKLVLNVFGKTKNTDLTRDEYDYAIEYYSELVDWFRKSYEHRLNNLERN